MKFSIVTTAAQTSTGEQKTETADSSVTVSLDAPIGDATVGLDNSGDVTISGTWSGVTVSHTAKTAGDATTASGCIRWYGHQCNYYKCRRYYHGLLVLQLVVLHVTLNSGKQAM